MVVWSHDNKYVVTGSQDKSIKVFSVEEGKEIHHWKDLHNGVLN